MTCENMNMMLSPDIGVPLSPDVDFADLRQYAEAACNAALELGEYGLDTNPDAGDQDVAAKLVTAYAQDEDTTNRKVTLARASKMTPASLILVRGILDEFGVAVASHAAEIRNLVTNKLLTETENPDPRIRIRALELLGKISDVGLFAEKTEVTITHQSTDDLRKKLREKFERIRQLDDVVTDVSLDGEVLDLDKLTGVELEGEIEEVKYDDEEEAADERS